MHRNQSFLWRFFAPVFRPAPLAVCLANQLRRGNDEGLGAAVAFADLRRSDRALSRSIPLTMTISTRCRRRPACCSCHLPWR